MMHDLWLAHPYKLIDLPICRRCGKPIDMYRFVDEECRAAEDRPSIADQLEGSSGDAHATIVGEAASQRDGNATERPDEIPPCTIHTPTPAELADLFAGPTFPDALSAYRYLLNPYEEKL